MQATVLFKKSTGNGGYLLARVGNEEVMCHQNDCDFSVVAAIKGDVIEIGRLDTGPRGLRGQQVSWVSHRQTEAVFPFEGAVLTIDYVKKFAFVSDDDGEDVFCHAVDFVDYGESSASFDAAARGTRVRGYRRDTARGRRGQALEVITS